MPVEFDKAGCIHCGKVIDIAVYPKDLKLRPKPGDVMICSGCCDVNVFTEDMQFREAELGDFDSEEVSPMLDGIEEAKKLQTLRKIIKESIMEIKNASKSTGR